MLRQFLILFAFLVGTCFPAEATTYYVATTGSDGNTCVQAKTSATPKLTIAGGIGCLAGGDTLQLAAGTYDEQTIQNVPAGSAGAYTIIKGAAGTRPLIKSTSLSNRGTYITDLLYTNQNYIEVSHFEFGPIFECMKIEGSDPSNWPHHIRFVDNVCHDTTNVGILTAASSNQVGVNHYFAQNTFYNVGIGTPGYIPGMLNIYNMGNGSIVENNTIHDGCNGISAWTGGPRVYDVIIRGNTLYDQGRAGATWQAGSSCNSAIRITSGTRAQVYNNVVYRVNLVGIQVDSAPEVDQVQIYNNTIYNTLGGQNGITVVAGATNITVKNNIAYLTGGISGGTNVSNNVTADPSFVNAGGNNFHLLTGSAAIGAGVNLSSVFTTDIDGVTRPTTGAWDCGAYCKGSALLKPPTGLTVVSTVSVTSVSKPTASVTPALTTTVCSP